MTIILGILIGLWLAGWLALLLASIILKADFCWWGWLLTPFYPAILLVDAVMWWINRKANP